MEISTLIKEPYLILGVISLVCVALNIVTFLEKVKQKLKRYKTNWKIRIKEEYQDNPLNIMHFIKAYESIVKRDEEFNKVELNISSNTWTGLSIIGAFFIGFILRLINVNDELIIGALFLLGTFFILSMISLIYWYAKN